MNLKLFQFIFQFSNPEEAEETIAALDGVKWPPGTPKQVTLFFVANIYKFHQKIKFIQYNVSYFLTLTLVFICDTN